MIRLETLTTKQDDLNRCLSARELKLRELYRATVTFLRITKNRSQGLNDTQHYDDGETSFLEANSISEGRYFDASTLPSPHGTNFSRGVPPVKLQSSYLLQTSSATKKSDVDTTEEGYGGRHKGKINNTRGVDLNNGLPQTNSASPVAKIGTQVEDEIQNRHSSPEEPAEQDGDNTRSLIQSRLPQVGGNAVTETFSFKQPEIATESLAVNLPGSSDPQRYIEQIPSKASINPSETLPLTSDDAGSMSASIVTTLASHQISSDPLTVQLPSKEVQESRFKQASNQENGGAEEQNFSPKVQSSNVSDTVDRNLENSKELVSAQPSAGTTILVRSAQDERKPDSQQSIYAHSPVQNVDDRDFSVSAGNTSVLKSQLELARLDSAFAGTPSTPDEQLRFEEAQSIQQSKLSSGPLSDQSQDQATSQQRDTQESISSQFVHGALDEDDNCNRGHTTTNAVIGQRSASSKDYDEPEPTLPTASLSLRDRAFSGMAGDSSKDLTLSRRPPMRIDTGVPYVPEPKLMSSKKTTTSSTMQPYTPISSSTPHKPTSSAAQAHSPPERMTTRVSSGALRHKSVSEILGEAPKHATQNGDKSPHERASNDPHREDVSIQTPKSASAVASPDPAAFKQRLNELRENQRSKLSTVIFARQQPTNSSRYLESSQSQRSEVNDICYEDEAYFRPLFAMQASVPPASHQLHTIVASAHKTLSTSNHSTNFREHQDCRILERILQLQSTNRWSLRQLERSVEPDRPTTHWDVLLSHMKWLRTDFREERKWKIVAAKRLADSCAEWVKNSLEGRKSLQIKVSSFSTRANNKPISAPTPDLVPSAEDDSSVTTDNDTPHLELSHGSAPAAIFSLPPEMFCFGVEKTPVTEKLLLELPLYQPSIESQNAALRVSRSTPDSIWKTPLIPLSKFAQGKIQSYEQGPPCKKSRYNYQDHTGSRENSISELFPPFEPSLEMMEPEHEDVALFNPENKHIRDRIHAGHAFRPPSEHVMPSQNFFESRQSSQWTQGEDDELRRLVREYAYNWSLISSCLSSPSMFASGAERRTPWECFERWIGLEGLPAEMSKTQYFRAYHSRLQAAQRTHEAQQQALQQTQGNNTPHLPVRRRTTQPYLVDRRKNDKHLRLVDAMRKLAKKRETALHKQQHVAGLAALRKANEAAQPRAAMYTPQEFSRIKYERECKLQESARAYRQQVLQHQKAAKAAQQSGQPNSGSHGMPPGRPPVSGVPNGTSPSINPSVPSGSHPQSSQGNTARSIPPMPRIMNNPQPNGVLSVPGNPQGVPHAPMQSHPMQPRAPPPMSPNDMRIFQEATRVQQEQQRYLAQQRQHAQTNGQPGVSASPNMGNPKIMSQPNSAALSGLQGRSGSPTANGNSVVNGSSSSPRMTTLSQPQPLSNGMIPAVNQISNQLKTHNPLASPEQITRMTTDTLNNYRVSQAAAQAAAMHAAAGINTPSLPNNANNINSLPQPQHQQAMMNGVGGNPGMLQYAQMMRNQQSNQQNRNTAGAMNSARPGSRGATPQTHRSGSAQGGPPPSQSPRPSQAQMAGGQ